MAEEEESMNTDGNQLEALRSALRTALEEEHPEHLCHNNTCDISAAIRHELYLWAARLLISATDCPVTEQAFLTYYDGDKEGGFIHDYERERQELLEVPHVRCPACNAVVWEPDSYGDTCGNCGGPIPAVRDEEEYDDT